MIAYYYFLKLHHIIVRYTKISFYERLKFNPLSSTLVNLTIFVLTWYDFTSFYIVLLVSISDWVFQTLSIFLGVSFMSPIKLHIKVLG